MSAWRAERLDAGAHPQFLFSLIFFMFRLLVDDRVSGELTNDHKVGPLERIERLPVNVPNHVSQASSRHSRCMAQPFCGETIHVQFEQAWSAIVP